MSSRTRWGALAMGAVLLIYLVFTAFYAIQLLRDPQPLVRALGGALIVLPLIGAWAAIAEFVFGFRVERLARRFAAEGDPPADGRAAPRPGRVDADEAVAEFAVVAEAVQRHPGSWQHWFRLGIAYDAARDRRRARWAMREAIRLERASVA